MAHGSKLRLTVLTPKGEKRHIYSTIGSRASFGANSLQQEIGLGSATKVERIDILWEKPNKSPTSFFNIPVNESIKLHENGKWKRLEVQPIENLPKANNP
jgi:hypothetical protein